MDPTNLIGRDLKTALYLPSFGLAYLYQSNNQNLFLILAIIIAVGASYTDVYLDRIIRRIIEKEEPESMEEIPDAHGIREYYELKSIPIVVFVFTFMAYVLSIFLFAYVGYDDLVLGGLVLVQIIILSRAVFKAVSHDLINPL